MPLAQPTKETRHRTKQEFVYSTLREAIMRCDLKPGERLVIDELARQLEVSAIPVREALQLLQSEGLVQSVPHVGATVATISHESIREVFTVLEGLEIVATRGAAERAQPEDIEALSGIVEGMDQALAQGDHEQWADLNTRFHLTISRLSAMPMLQEMLARALDHWDRVR
ncbi:MAG TPA: GntR family transcriptional regulator, partial [Vicinamibacteria bacterium]